MREFLHFLRIFAWRHATYNPGRIRVSRIIAFLHEVYKGVFGFLYPSFYPLHDSITLYPIALYEQNMGYICTLEHCMVLCELGGANSSPAFGTRNWQTSTRSLPIFFCRLLSPGGVVYFTCQEAITHGAGRNTRR